MSLLARGVRAERESARAYRDRGYIVSLKNARRRRSGEGGFQLIRSTFVISRVSLSLVYSTCYTFATFTKRFSATHVFARRKRLVALVVVFTRVNNARASARTTTTTLVLVVENSN